MLGIRNEPSIHKGRASSFLSEVVAQATVLRILKDSHSEQSKVFMDKDIFTVKSLILAQDER